MSKSAVVAAGSIDYSTLREMFSVGDQIVIRRTEYAPEPHTAEVKKICPHFILVEICSNINKAKRWYEAFGLCDCLSGNIINKTRR